MNSISKNTEYTNWVLDLKDLISHSQIKASLSVNSELIHLYWTIGKSISTKIKTEKWGTSVVEELSKDLKKAFPNQKGFSRSNLFSMRKLYEFFLTSELTTVEVQQLVGQIPWGQNIVIISKSINEALRFENTSTKLSVRI